MMKNFKTIDELKAFVPRYFHKLEPVKNKTIFTCKVRVYNYFDMVSVAANLLKLCALATHDDGQEVSELVHNNSIDVNRIIELALQFMPYDQAELADEIYSMLERDSTEQK